jgi:RNA polymerase sigma factor (sigma-70 family)
MQKNTSITQGKIAYQTKVIEAIKNNDQNVLKSIYIGNYHKVESFILNNNGTKEHAKDIYQEAFVALWSNIKKNKFNPESESAVNRYLFTIAKNKWMDHLKSPVYIKKAHLDKRVVMNEMEGASDLENREAEYEFKLSQAMDAFECLGDSCKIILTKFYFEKKSIKQIAVEMSLDPASARNKKYRCMQHLRERVLGIE